jgi:hypothetical protein
MLTPCNSRDDTLFATVASRHGRMRYHLLAERLPQGGWDWTTWRAGDSPNTAQHGCAPTARMARRRPETQSGTGTTAAIRSQMSPTFEAVAVGPIR